MQKDTVKVISAEPLNAETKKKIENIFSKKHKETQTFIYEISPDILGGILVIDNDNYYDGTLKRQLLNIKQLI